MEQKRTNRETLAKGVKILAFSLLAITLGPIVLHNAFMNKTHPLFFIIAGIGILIMLGAIYLILRGLKLILSSFFD